MSAPSAEPLTIDVVSDVVCPWCFIGKRRLEQAIALKPGIPVTVRYRPYFLNPWVPREGMSREEYLTTKFGSVARYRANAQRIVMAAREEGLAYNVDAITRQPNTVDCHRLILWSGETGDPAHMKQRLMELYFTEGTDLSDPLVLVGAAQDCGMDPDDVRRRLASDKDVAEITAEAEAAKTAGIEGVPCFILGGVFAVSGRSRRNTSPTPSNAPPRSVALPLPPRRRHKAGRRDRRHSSPRVGTGIEARPDDAQYQRDASAILNGSRASHARGQEGSAFQQPRQMRSLSSMSSRDAAVALSSSRRGPDGRSESRGWRCPTGACKGTERESGARGVVPAPIPALSRVASWADAGHVKSATARTAATAMNFDIVNSVCSTRAEELPVRRIAVARTQKVMCSKGVAPQKDTHHRHLVSSLPSLKNPPGQRGNRKTRRRRLAVSTGFFGPEKLS